MPTRSYPPDPDIVSTIFSLELARVRNNIIPLNSECNRTISLGTHPNPVFRVLAQGKVKAHEIPVSQGFDGSRFKLTEVAKEQFDDLASSFHSAEQKKAMPAFQLGFFMD